MRVLRAVGAALVLVGLLLAVTSTASAQQTLPPLVTDYANYPDTPEAMLTDGCDATGVTGVMFSLNDGTPGDNEGQHYPSQNAHGKHLTRTRWATADENARRSE